MYAGTTSATRARQSATCAGDFIEQIAEYGHLRTVRRPITTARGGEIGGAGECANLSARSTEVTCWSG